MNNRQKLVYELIEALRVLSKVKWFLGNPRLTLEEFMVLDMIAESGSCSMKDIVSTFSIPASTATGLIDRLVESKYVSRSKSNEDRRRVIIKMTAKGKKVHESFKTEALAQLEESVKHLTKEDLVTLIKLVKKLTAGLRKTE